MDKVLTNYAVLRAAIVSSALRLAIWTSFPIFVVIVFQGNRLNVVNLLWIVPLVDALLFPMFFVCCVLAAKQRLSRNKARHDTFVGLSDREKGRFVGTSI